MRSDPYYDEKSLAEFYDKEYRKLYSGTEKPTEQFFLEQRTFGRDIVAFLSGEIFGGETRGKKIFEVGCGAGGILESFRETGNEVFGCDYGRKYIKYGKEKGLLIVEGGVESLRAFGAADVIILNHTLEHLRNPRLELSKIRELLSPHGVLYIALPGIFSIHNTHVWHFTLKTLNRLLADAGFKLKYGDEKIVAVYQKGAEKNSPPKENSESVKNYLKKIKRFEWYYTARNLSLKHCLRVLALYILSKNRFLHERARNI